MSSTKDPNAPANEEEEEEIVNPHIPEFMAKAPWYAQASEEGKGLDHQRRNVENNFDDFNAHYAKGVKTFQAKRFRRGACKNCGAMSHKTRDCCERPRKVKASISRRNIAADELVHEELKLTWDGKRDQYKGWNPASQKALIEKSQQAEIERTRLREELKLQKLEEKKKEISKRREKGEEVNSEEELLSSSEDEEDDVVLKDEDATVAQDLKRYNTKAKMTVRNLRIREDTAKYLLNLDVNSAHYDPKSRSMRADPNPHLDPSERTFTGDNDYLNSEDAGNLMSQQVFAWEAQKRGQDVHQMANPTQTIVMQKEYEKRKAMLKNKKKTMLTSKYGGEEYLQKKMDPKLLMGQTENYVEYSADGRVIKGDEEKVEVKSRFDEDVFPGNHTSVWGSWYNKADDEWGYACCHQTMFNAICLGESNKATVATKKELSPEEQMLEQLRQNARAQMVAEKKKLIDQQEKKKETKKRATEEDDEDKKKPRMDFGYGYDSETPEEKEAFLKNRVHADDPFQ